MAEQEAGDPAQGSSDGYQEWTPLPISSLSPNYHHVQQAFWSWSHQTSQSMPGQLDQWPQNQQQTRLLQGGLRVTAGHCHLPHCCCCPQDASLPSC